MSDLEKQKSFLNAFVEKNKIMEKSEELFNSSQDLKIIPDKFGKVPLNYLSRSKQMIELVKGEVLKVINDYKSGREKY